MGLERAEARLLEAIRSRPRSVALDVRVVGGRAARSHALRIGARWIPARPGTLPRRATMRADLVHLLGLDLPPPRNSRFVVMVHDLSPLHYDDEGQLPPWVERDRRTCSARPDAIGVHGLRATDASRRRRTPDPDHRWGTGVGGAGCGAALRRRAERPWHRAAVHASLRRVHETKGSSVAPRRMDESAIWHSRAGRAFSEGRRTCPFARFVERSSGRSRLRVG